MAGRTWARISSPLCSCLHVFTGVVSSEEGGRRKPMVTFQATVSKTLKVGFELLSPVAARLSVDKEKFFEVRPQRESLGIRKRVGAPETGVKFMSFKLRSIFLISSDSDFFAHHFRRLLFRSRN